MMGTIPSWSKLMLEKRYKRAMIMIPVHDMTALRCRASWLRQMDRVTETQTRHVCVAQGQRHVVQTRDERGVTGMEFGFVVWTD